jgi:type I restriction enzyme S subunit
VDGRWVVPRTWKWVLVGEIADVVGGGTPNTADQSNFSQNGIPWITPADLSHYASTYVTHGKRQLSAQGLESSSARILPRGAVLFSSRAPIGYCVIAANPITTNQGFKSLVLKDGISPEFVRHYLLASTEYVSSLASGTTFKEISGSKMKKVLVPLPPAAEQVKIVSALTSICESIATQRSNLARVTVLASRGREAILNSAYDGELGSASDTQVENCRLGAIIEQLDQGWSPQCLNTPTEDGSVWAVMTTTAIQALAFNSFENKVLPPTLSPREHLAIRSGDVLITRAGPRRRVGISCVVEQTKPNLILCDKAYRLRVNADVVRPKYLAYMMNASRSLELLEAMKTGISDSGLNLTQAKLLELPIPMRSIEEQDALIMRLDAAFLTLHEVDEEAIASRLLLERLHVAFYRRAFTGRLTK